MTERQNKRVTSVDIAKAAGVSQSTVSRALANDQRISETTRREIKTLAARLGYTPNEMARSLQTQKSTMIGVIMADLQNPYYPAVLEKLTQKIHAMGRQLLLLSVPDGVSVDEMLPSMLSYQVEGIIITSAVLSSRMHDHLRDLNTPVVLYNRSVESFFINSVCCENVVASRKVADLLVRGGNSRVAFIGGHVDTSTHRERRIGLQEGLRQHGLDIVSEDVGGNSYDGGYRAALNLLSQTPRPDAIFCIADVMALGALDAARSGLGLSVPGDVSIVGFDDIPAAAWPAYDLTTVRQPSESMVGKALSLLLEPKGSPPAAVRVPGELIIRGSARLG